MTAKEYLQQVKVKDARIRNLQRDMAALRGLMFSLGNSSVEGERVQTSPDPDKFGTLYSKIDGKERQIVESIDDLVDFILRVTEEIGQLKERDEEKAPSVKINDEAVKVGAITFGKGTKAYRCPNCKRLVIYRDRFCRDCGQRLKWEEYYAGKKIKLLKYLISSHFSAAREPGESCGTISRERYRIKILQILTVILSF